MDLDQLQKQQAQSAQPIAVNYSGIVNRISGSDVFVVIPSKSKQYEYGPVDKVSVGVLSVGDKVFVGFDDDQIPWVVGQGTDIATQAELDAVAASTVRTGVIEPFAGFTAPTGYLMCDNAAVSRTTYATLFSTICLSTTGNTTSASASVTGIPSTALMVAGMPISGPGIPAATTILTVNSGVAITLSANATATGTAVALVIAPHGVGDGSTTFNVPNGAGRTLVGAGTATGAAGATAHRLGQAAGEETHVLTEAELAAHTHAASRSNAQVIISYGGQEWIGNHVSPYYTSGSAGGNTPHNTMQPYLGVNWIIKT